CVRRIEQLNTSPMEKQENKQKATVNSQKTYSEASVNQAEATSPVQPSEDEPSDPLRFLLKHRALDGKKVTFESRDGTITGVVRGLVAPFLKVETSTGFTVKVRPSEIKKAESVN